MTYTITDGTSTLFTATLMRDRQFQSYTRGVISPLSMTFPDSTEYEKALDYTEYVGAATWGRTLGGEPWYVETVPDAAPVDSHVVLIETPNTTWAYPDFWVLLTDARNATIAPGTDLRIDFDGLFLAEGSEYITRAGVEAALGSSLTG